MIALDDIPGVRLVEVGEMWCRLFSKYLLKVKVSEATNAWKDDQICVVLKVGIDGDVHGVQSIWEANSTEENWEFYLLT